MHYICAIYDSMHHDNRDKKNRRTILTYQLNIPGTSCSRRVFLATTCMRDDDRATSCQHGSEGAGPTPFSLTPWNLITAKLPTSKMYQIVAEMRNLGL